MTTAVPESVRLAVRAREHHRCARCQVPVPLGHIHHRRGRAVVDEHTHCRCNCVLLCHRCHAEIHSHPFASRASGWIVSRYCADPSEVPLIITIKGREVSRVLVH